MMNLSQAVFNALWPQDHIDDAYGGTICNLEDSQHNNDPVEILDDLKARSDYTPDFDHFRRHKHTLVFNYMHRYNPKYNYSKILDPENSAYLGRAYTVQKSYVMFETLTGSSMVAFRQEKERPKTPHVSPLFESHIIGTLYALSPLALLNLDRVLGNTVRYQRERVFVIPREQPSDYEKESLRTAVPARMYFGLPEYWQNIPMRKGTNTKDANGKWMWT